MKNHYYWIDYAKTIGLLLMILGHGNMVNDEFCHYIYSFHMPLFFIISGLLTRTPNGGGENYHKYPKKLHGFNGTIFLYEHILLTVFFVC